MIVDRQSKMEICYGCACENKIGACGRRKLYSNSTSYILPIITLKFRELYSSEDVEKLLLSTEPEGKEPEIYICMRCF